MKERELSKRTELRKKKPTALFSFPSSSKGQVARWRSFQAASFCCSGIWTFTSSFKICLMLTLYPCHVWVRNFWFGRVQWVEHRGLVVCSLKLLFFDVFFWHVGHGKVWFWLGVRLYFIPRLHFSSKIIPLKRKGIYMAWPISILNLFCFVGCGSLVLVLLLQVSSLLLLHFYLIILV